MPYTLYKTNSIKLTVVEDGKINVTTDLQLVGKNYAGYGQIVNENFVKLLENFSNGAAPANPLIGQIWYDSINKRIKYYTGLKWNQLLSSTISATRPVDLNNGEFWFDSSTLRLYIKHRDSFTLIGPSSATAGTSGGGTSVGTSIILGSDQTEYTTIKLSISDAVTPVVVSQFSFDVDATDPIVSQFTKIKNGITLLGADPVTGVSSNNGTYFWGTAADAIKLNGRPSTDFLLSTDVNLIAGNITELGSITRISTGSPSTIGYIEGAWELTSGSTLQATYADLAERYEADRVYEFGTVLIIGGEKEVTITDQRASIAVAGVVSKNPAFKMNSDAGTDETHPYIALKGRIPCKVTGSILKGDLLVTSSRFGFAERMQPGDDPSAVIGKALENFEGSFGVIEVKV